MAVSYSGYKFLKVAVEDAVATVTMNRPGADNAIDTTALDELSHHIFQDLQADEQVRAVVITGAGKAFSVGADVNEMAKIATEGSREGLGASFAKKPAARAMIEAMLDLNKPIIAAVNGDAAGLGASIALFSDIVIAAATARFASTNILLGLVPGDGSTVIWPILIGPAKAMEYLLTGDWVDAKKADEWGMVNKVVPPAELMPTVKDMAKELAGLSRYSVSTTKAALNAAIRADIDTYFHLGAAAEQMSYHTDEHKQRVKAFVAKRK